MSDYEFKFLRIKLVTQSLLVRHFYKNLCLKRRYTLWRNFALLIGKRNSQYHFMNRYGMVKGWSCYWKSFCELLVIVVPYQNNGMCRMRRIVEGYGFRERELLPSSISVISGRYTPEPFQIRSSLLDYTVFFISAPMISRWISFVRDNSSSSFNHPQSTFILLAKKMQQVTIN